MIRELRGIESMANTRLHATPLTRNRYAVRPAGQLGTHGWYPFPWSVVYVMAATESEAIRKAGEL